MVFVASNEWGDGKNTNFLEYNPEISYFVLWMPTAEVSEMVGYFGVDGGGDVVVFVFSIYPNVKVPAAVF